MADRFLIVPKDERMLEFVLAKIGVLGTDTDYFEDGETIVFPLSLSEEDYSDLVAELIFHFCKSKVFLSAITPKEFDTGEFYALIGTLVGIEREKEREIVKMAINGEKNVYLKGLLDFSLSELEEAWKNLSALAEKLYAQCNSTVDVYALCVFLLGMTEGLGKRIVIDEEANIRIPGIDPFVIVPSVFEDNEKNFL